MSQEILIAPSILSADFARLGEEVAAITQAGADWIHIDVMDGHFVPNITIGPEVVRAIRRHSTLPFDAHLMIAPADPYIQAFADAGADRITIHPDAGPHLHRSIQHIKSLGKSAGVALNPATPIEDIINVLDTIDQVLVMTVNPGFGGQKFIESQLSKITQISDIISAQKLDVIIEVDGGINRDTAPKAIKAGAKVLVAGTAVFTGSANKYSSNIAALRS